MFLKPGLYIISTPIGNLDDITIRAIDILKRSNLIYCEDTRISRKLLAKHCINDISLKKYNDYSDQADRDLIKQFIREGQVISLISDAGTPLISDPGYKLVRDLKQESMHIDVIPGACAAITALVGSALPTDKFLFMGFLPKTIYAKEKIYKELSNLDVTLIFYDSPHRLVNSLEVALKSLGNREANVSRELTKSYQESNYDTLENLILYYKENTPMGEVIITISGKNSKDQIISDEEIKNEIKHLLKDSITVRDISKILATKYQSMSIQRRDIYQMALLCQQEERSE